MPQETGQQPKICLISSIPVTLWSFYRGLIRQLRDYGFSITLISSDLPELHTMEKELDCSIFPAEISRQITPLQDMLTILKLVRLFRRNRYDLVHAHTPKAGLLGMIAARIAGIKNRVYTCHGLPLETESGLKRQLLACAERASCALAHQVLVVSHSLVDKLSKYKICSKSKLTVLGEGTACGVDLNRFTVTPELFKKSRDIRNNYGISEKDLVVGFIGRLVPDKGIHILVESFARLHESNPGIRLLVLGDFEPHRGRLSDDTIEILRNHGGITRCGFTPEIELYYAAMDMLVLPTRREGFPYTLLEAAAMGLPVIATRVTGCVDAVVDGVTGLLVEVDDVQEMFEAMLRLAKDPELRKRLGRQGRKRVESMFDSAVLIQEHTNLYNKLLLNGTG